jgi:thiol-disulfide isomerase/thioredoxin
MKNVALTFLRLLCAASAGLVFCVASWAGPEVGEQAKLKTVLVSGQKLSLDQLKGKVVMVNFWATWCTVCKAEMPGWQKFYEANKDRGFELIAMSIDEDQAELKKHAAKYPGYTFPVAWRWDDATDDNFGDIIGTPTMYVLDKAGKVAWTRRGRVTTEQLAAVVEPLLKQP